MMIRKLALSTAAASLALAPVASQAADASSVRTSADVVDFDSLSGGAGAPIILAVLAVAAIIWAVSDADEDDEDEPISP